MRSLSATNKAESNRNRNIMRHRSQPPLATRAVPYILGICVYEDKSKSKKCNKEKTGGFFLSVPGSVHVYSLCCSSVYLGDTPFPYGLGWLERSEKFYWAEQLYQHIFGSAHS